MTKERPSRDDVHRPQAGGTPPGTIIAAFVRARLLGIKILTLDARIVHVGADAVPDAAAAAAAARVMTPLTEGATARRDGRRGDLAYAALLLEQSTKDMDELRGTGGR